MKVHPAPKATFPASRSGAVSCVGQAPASPRNQKGSLKRLPHVFTSVLQLPLPSDAAVAVEETADCFRFSAAAAATGLRDVMAEVIEMHPGLVKVVVRGADAAESDSLELELDVWRFRLPASTRPELATAVCAGGELVVTVPKDGGLGTEGFWGGVDDGIMGHLGSLVLAQ